MSVVVDVKGRQIRCCGARSTGFSNCPQGPGFVCLLLPGHSGDHKAFGLWPEETPRIVAQWPNRAAIENDEARSQGPAIQPFAVEVDSAHPEGKA